MDRERNSISLYPLRTKKRKRGRSPAGVAPGVLAGVVEGVVVVPKEALAGVVEGMDPNVITAAAGWDWKLWFGFAYWE